MGLYIHVPFCGSLCSYCHFVRTADHDPAVRRRFVQGVRAEFELRASRCDVLREGRRPLATAYVGGGTPSCLEPELMTDLVAGTVGRLAAAADLEFTAEANPESLTPEIAAAWREAGINRISLGVQSLQDEALALLGRSCRPARARGALELACRIFPRVSADWIIGPGLDRARLRDELSAAADLGVEHFSVYILEIHAGTPLAERVAAGETTLPTDVEVEATYLAAGEHLAGLGIHQYEVANFARPGAESRHNRNYWRGRPWLGLGPGAHGYWGRRRYANFADPARWLEAVESGIVPEESVDPLGRAERRLERLVLALRTVAGVPLADVPAGALDLDRGLDEGLWILGDGRLRLTPRGFLRIDTIEERLARALPDGPGRAANPDPG